MVTGRSGSARVGNTACRIVLQSGCPYLAAATVAVVSNFSPAIMLAPRTQRDDGWIVDGNPGPDRAKPSRRPCHWHRHPFVAGLTRRSAPHVRCPDDDAGEEKEQATPTPAARAPVHRLADGVVVGFWQWRGRQRSVGGVRLSGRTPWRADWRRARPCRAGIGSWLFLCSARSCETISL